MFSSLCQGMSYTFWYV